MDETETWREKRIKELSGKGGKAEKPVEVSDGNFAENVKAGLVLVDFWAPWCGPCRMIAPVLEHIAKDYAGRARILKLNVDENPATASKYGIMSIPTMVIFSSGKPADTIVGFVPKQSIEAKLDAALSRMA